jgi:hypothetical protein
MTNVGIRTAADIESFFQAYNEHKWDVLFEQYMSEDCFRYASEQPLRGKQEMLDYWTQRHSAFKETLGKPENVVFGQGHSYLQVNIRLDLQEDGSFYGKSYTKGDVLEFRCVDYYEYNAEGKIQSGLVFIKFFN